MDRCGIDEKFYEVAKPGSLAERLLARALGED
jgi:hypothetical protein